MLKLKKHASSRFFLCGNTHVYVRVREIMQWLHTKTFYTVSQHKVNLHRHTTNIIASGMTKHPIVFVFYLALLHDKSPLASKIEKNNPHFLDALARCTQMGII